MYRIHLCIVSSEGAAISQLAYVVDKKRQKCRVHPDEPWRHSDFHSALSVSTPNSPHHSTCTVPGGGGGSGRGGGQYLGHSIPGEAGVHGPGVPVFLQQQLVVSRVGLDQQAPPAEEALHVQGVGARLAVQRAAFYERAARLTDTAQLGRLD